MIKYQRWVSSVGWNQMRPLHIRWLGREILIGYCASISKSCAQGSGALAMLLRISETPVWAPCLNLSLVFVLLLPAHVLFLHMASEMRQTEKKWLQGRAPTYLSDVHLPFVPSVWAPKKGISRLALKLCSEPGWKDDKGQSRWVFYFNELREFTGIFFSLLICLCRPLRISLRRLCCKSFMFSRTRRWNRYQNYIH